MRMPLAVVLCGPNVHPLRMLHCLARVVYGVRVCAGGMWVAVLCSLFLAMVSHDKPVFTPPSPIEVGVLRCQSCGR
jgi:hypothetical protein